MDCVRVRRPQQRWDTVAIAAWTFAIAFGPPRGTWIVSVPPLGTLGIGTASWLGLPCGRALSLMAAAMSPAELVLAPPSPRSS